MTTGGNVEKTEPTTGKSDQLLVLDRILTNKFEDLANIATGKRKIEDLIREEIFHY